MNENYLVLDTETGGLDADKYSLLTISGVVLSVNNVDNKLIFTQLDKFDYKIKKDRIEDYVVTESAMKINNINLNDLMAEGITENELTTKLTAIKNKWFNSKKINIIGHNVWFDIAFIKQAYRNTDNYELYESTFNHRALDTCVIGRFLNIIGIINPESCSLGTLCEYFNINPDNGLLHTSMYDALMTAEVFKNLCTVIGSSEMIAPLAEFIYDVT